MESKDNRYSDFVRKLSSAAAKHKGAVLKTLGAVEDLDLYHLSLNPDLKKRVCIIAGIHGDEPGGPEGVVHWLADYEAPTGIGIDIIPMANPYGYVHNTRNNKHYDMNRQWEDGDKLQHENALILKVIKEPKYDMLLTLHEDPEQKDGFYLYCSDRSREKLWKDCVALAKKYFPVYNKDEVWGDPVQNGLCWHDKLRATKNNKCLETWMHDHRGVPYVTTETSDIHPLSKRVRFMGEFVDFILKNL